MKWEDMPEESRPILVTQTNYPYYPSTQSLTMEDEAIQRNWDTQWPNYKESQMFYGPKSGAVKVTKGSSKADVILLGKQSEPYVFGHELGHIFGSKKARERHSKDEINRELEAWRWYFDRLMEMNSSIPLEAKESATWGLTSYIGNKAKAKMLVNRLVKEVEDEYWKFSTNFNI